MDLKGWEPKVYACGAHESLAMSVFVVCVVELYLLWLFMTISNKMI